MVFQVEGLPNGAADSREIAALSQVIRAGAANNAAKIVIDHDGGHLNVTIHVIDPLSFWGAIKPNLAFTGTTSIVFCDGKPDTRTYITLRQRPPLQDQTKYLSRRKE